MATKNFIVTGEQMSTFYNRSFDLERQFRAGVLDPMVVLPALQLLGKGKNPFIALTADTVSDVEPEYSRKVKAQWKKTYKRMGIRADYSTLGIIEERPGYWVCLSPKGSTAQGNYLGLQKLFRCDTSINGNFDEVVESDRSVETSAYYIYVKAVVEADEENKNTSYNQLKAHGFVGITLAERLALEGWYFVTTGKHLDIDNWTMCTGSRCGAGRVPSVRWLDGKLFVDWYHRDDAHGNLRARQAVLP